MPASPSALTLPTRVLSFWFRDFVVGAAPSAECLRLWFTPPATQPVALRHAVRQAFAAELRLYLREKSEADAEGPLTKLESAGDESLLALTILAQHVAPFVTADRAADIPAHAPALPALPHSDVAAASRVAQSLSLLAESNGLGESLDPVEQCFLLTPCALSEDRTLTALAASRALSLSQRYRHTNYAKFLSQFHARAASNETQLRQFGRLPQLNQHWHRIGTPREALPGTRLRASPSGSRMHLEWPQ